MVIKVGLGRHPDAPSSPTAVAVIPWALPSAPERGTAGQRRPPLPQGRMGEVPASVDDVSINYGSGLMVSVHEMGAGQFILNTLRAWESLGKRLGPVGLSRRRRGCGMPDSRSPCPRTGR